MMDRFDEGLPDPQCVEILGYCSYCGMEIYAPADNIDIHDACEAEETADNEEFEEDNI